MKIFKYWSIANDVQLFSPYLHSRIGLTKGVTIFVGIILQELEQSNFSDEFVCSAYIAKSFYGVNASEFREAIKWFRKSSFATVDIVYQDTGMGAYKSTSIKIDFVEFCLWLQSDDRFMYEIPFNPISPF